MKTEREHLFWSRDGINSFTTTSFNIRVVTNRTELASLFTHRLLAGSKS